jgi:hypothetical protein
MVADDLGRRGTGAMERRVTQDRRSMMARPFIVVGDKLSHGGSAWWQSTGQTDINMTVARVGDLAKSAMHGATSDRQVASNRDDRGPAGGARWRPHGVRATLMALQATTGLR